MTMRITRASKLAPALLLGASFLAAHAVPAAAAQEAKRKTELFAPGADHAAHQQPSFSGGSQPTPAGRPPLYEGLGKGSFPVTTGSSQA